MVKYLVLSKVNLMFSLRSFQFLTLSCKQFHRVMEDANKLLLAAKPNIQKLILSIEISHDKAVLANGLTMVRNANVYSNYFVLGARVP